MSWYYARQGAQVGPVSTEDLRAKIKQGEVVPSDLAWQEGMGSWKPVGEIPELAPVVQDGPQLSGTLGAGPGVTTAPPSESPPPPAQQAPSQMVAQPAPGMTMITPPPPSSGLAIASMICGIISFFLCGVWALGGIPAVICGHMALKNIAQAPSRIEGRGMALAGVICGWITIAIQILWIGAIIVSALAKS